MEINDFVKKFAEAIDVEDLNVIDKNTDFHDLDEWSSLAALSIIAMVDEEYDITIGGNDIRYATTIEDLFNAVKAKA